MVGSQRQINGTDILNDLRSGMADSELLVKHKLSAKSLQTVFKKLVASKVVSRTELYERSALFREKIDLVKARAHPRADLAVRVPIYDMGSGATGVLRDISETGLRVAGIESSVGQAKTFQVPLDMFIQAEPLLIIAECRWVEIKGRHRRYPVAGFAIMDLPETDREVLRDFITFLLLSESGEWQTIG
jgi:PilZ domain